MEFLLKLKKKTNKKLPYVIFQCLYFLYLQFSLTGNNMYVYTIDKYLHRRHRVMRAPVPILVVSSARFVVPCA